MADERDEALSSIADWGLSSAAAVVERILALGRAGANGFRFPLPSNGGAWWPLGPDRAGDEDGAAADAADPTERARQARRFRADAERMVELYGDFTRMLIDGAATFAEQAAGVPAPTNGHAPAADVLVLGPASAGATTTSTAWLHVLDGPPAPAAPLHASDLHAHDGSVVAASAVRCTPDALDTSAARRSSEVRVTIEVPADTAPGTYHGHLLATGLPEVVLPLRLDVVA